MPDVRREPTVPEIDSTVHEPARLRVLALLAAVASADFMYILARTGLSRGNLSVQMRRLEEAGLVDADREIDGRRPRTTYSLSAVGRERLRRYAGVMQTLIGGFDR